MKSFEKLTCAEIAIEVYELLSEKGYALADNYELQEFNRTKTRLSCKGLSHDADGAPSPISLFAWDSQSGIGTSFSFEDLPIEQWDCSDSALMMKHVFKTYGEILNDILHIEEVTPLNVDDEFRESKIICKGVFIFDTLTNEHLLFVAGWTEEGLSVGLYYGELIKYHSNEIYYLPPATNEIAQKLLTFLKNEDVIDHKSGSSFQIRQYADTYEVRWTVKDGLEREVIIFSTLRLACILEESDVFPSDYQIDVLAVSGNSLTGFDDIITRQFCG